MALSLFPLLIVTDNFCTCYSFPPKCWCGIIEKLADITCTMIMTMKTLSIRINFNEIIFYLQGTQILACAGITWEHFQPYIIYIREIKGQPAAHSWHIIHIKKINICRSCIHFITWFHSKFWSVENFWLASMAIQRTIKALLLSVSQCFKRQIMQRF